jgi:hypothetical protein
VRFLGSVIGDETRDRTRYFFAAFSTNSFFHFYGSFTDFVSVIQAVVCRFATSCSLMHTVPVVCTFSHVSLALELGGKLSLVRR